ncbi:hypothetical protein EPUS_01331 [Endocarpon pusillum Z07020]|uniref:Uncharacterized protein n=1 Tax=Endocarpon pusillum (strain Z07020 / HMAS-L-300199) TaxID=1263415 RepID=U1HYK9_ENDPU|nr:uncharacterized protein EPUS_01331 [Endocarpon pusillum Z07020]ERF75965.1 hypothetical protein EPUS_01331 [Endocarpon pusillum Z07020]
MLHKAVLALLLVICSQVIAQEPFLYYNTSIPIGQAGFVRWDTNAFAGPVNLWLQQLAPNASAPQVPLDYSNTKGFFLWSAGSNLTPGQYFYQLQSVGGQGIIFKSNPLMVLCSECPASTSSLPPLTSGATATATGADGQPTAGVLPSEVYSSSGGSKLSVGAAAGIGVGGALGAVAIIGLGFFLFRRARKRKQSQKQPPSNFAPSTHHPSLAPTSPPPQFSSPYSHPQEVKTGYGDPPPMSLAPDFGPGRNASHELDSAALAGSPQTSAYHSQAASMTPKRMPSPLSTGIIAPQPRSPPPTLTSSGFQYQRQPHGQVSPPIATGQRTPVSTHDSTSYGFPSSETSPNPESEGFQFQTPQQQAGMSSPDSQHRLYPRRAVGSTGTRGVSQ